MIPKGELSVSMHVSEHVSKWVHVERCLCKLFFMMASVQTNDWTHGH